MKPSVKSRIKGAAFGALFCASAVTLLFMHGYEEAYKEHGSKAATACLVALGFMTVLGGIVGWFTGEPPGVAD